MIDFHLDWHVLGQFFEPLRANGDLVWAPGHGEDITNPPVSSHGQRAQKKLPRVCLLKSLHDPHHPCLSASANLWITSPPQPSKITTYLARYNPELLGRSAVRTLGTRSWMVITNSVEMTSPSLGRLAAMCSRFFTTSPTVPSIVTTSSFAFLFSMMPSACHDYLLADDVVGRHHADKSSSSNRLSSSNVASLRLKEDLGLHERHTLNAYIREHSPAACAACEASQRWRSVRFLPAPSPRD